MAMQWSPLGAVLPTGFTPFSIAFLNQSESDRSVKCIAVGSKLSSTQQQIGAACIVDVENVPKLRPLSLSADAPGIKCVSAMGFGCVIGDFRGGVAFWDVERMTSSQSSSSGEMWRAKSASGALVNALDTCGGKTLFSSGGDGTVLQKQQERIKEKSNVESRIRLEPPQDGSCGAREVATASKDGLVRIYDLRVPDCVCSFGPFTSSASSSSSPPSSSSGSAKSALGEVEDCWAVAFGGAISVDERLVAAGYSSGAVRLFDLRRAGSDAVSVTSADHTTNSSSPLIWTHSTGYGVCALEFDSTAGSVGRLAVAMLESRFRVYDFGSILPENLKTSGAAAAPDSLGSYFTDHLAIALSAREPPFVQRMAHDSTVWSLKHSPFHRDVFATAGGDGGLRFWDYTPPRPGSPPGALGLVNERLRVKAHTQPVLCVDWHRGFDGLCCFATMDQHVGVGVVSPVTDPAIRRQ